MDAIEFKTVIKEGGVIQLPEKYTRFSTGEIKVILLKEEETETKDKVAQQYEQVKAIIREIQD
jgi:hypothetical protein